MLGSPTPEVGTPEVEPAPTSGGQGVGVPGSPGAGGAPTAKGVVRCEEYYYRNTRMGGYTRSLLVLDGGVLRPNAKVRSRTGRHGKDVYCLTEDQWQRVWWVKLEQSNSGKRAITCSTNIPREVAEVLERMWLYEDHDAASIAEAAVMLYRLYIRGEVSG